MKQEIYIHNQDDFKKMREAGKLACYILDFISNYVEEGITTDELDKLCHNEIIKHNAIPAPLNYNGFPKSICTSINHVVCHGIPSSRKLKKGDILNIDVTVILNGYHGDTSRMYKIGKISKKAELLCQVTYDAMMKAISIVKDGQSFSEIGNVIEKYVKDYNFSIVRDYCGHGIGKIFHGPPNILHYKNNQSNFIMKEGMFFTIEPMINLGSYKTILSKIDGWTVTTRDKLLSAQYEHTIGVTKDGYEIFTSN